MWHSSIQAIYCNNGLSFIFREAVYWRSAALWMTKRWRSTRALHTTCSWRLQRSVTVSWTRQSNGSLTDLKQSPGYNKIKVNTNKVIGGASSNICMETGSTDTYIMCYFKAHSNWPQWVSLEKWQLIIYTISSFFLSISYENKLFCVSLNSLAYLDGCGATVIWCNKVPNKNILLYKISVISVMVGLFECKHSCLIYFAQ